MPLTEETIVRTLLAARPRLNAAIWLIARDAATAEDIFQDVSVKALTSGASFEHEGSLLSWAHVVARREAMDWLRRRRPEVPVLDSDVLELLEREWATQPAPSGGRVDALRNCLERTPPESRRLLELRYFEGRSCQEVSSAVGASIDAVYQRIARLHRQLKNCVERQLGTGAPAAEEGAR